MSEVLPGIDARQSGGEQTIAIGVDGSRTARLAALRAIDIFGAQSTYVLIGVGVLGAFASEKRGLARALERTRKLVENARARAVVVEREGDPAVELALAAAEHRAMVLVVGARGAVLLSDVSKRIGSVCLALLENRQCDVLVIPNYTDQAEAMRAGPPEVGG